MRARDSSGCTDAAAAWRRCPGFDEAWTEDDALVDIVRARLSGFGPLPAPVIARALAVPVSSVALALTRLEAEGYVMRGRFTPGAKARQTRATKSGANGICWRVFIDTPCGVCGAKSSRSSCRISCVSCSTGNTSARMQKPIRTATATTR
jgi:hypothetical protein